MIYQCFYDSPLGKIELCSDGENLTKLRFVDTEAQRHVNKDALPVFQEAFAWLDSYFGGNNPNFMPKYCLDGLTSFHKLVLQELEKIPHGSTITYGEIAKTVATKLGIAKMSAQAVGNAVGRNPICLIIPCHRVVGVNNNLTGYAGGLERKKRLLALEGHDLNSFRRLGS